MRMYRPPLCSTIRLHPFYRPITIFWLWQQRWFVPPKQSNACVCCTRRLAYNHKLSANVGPPGISHVCPSVYPSVHSGVCVLVVVLYDDIPFLASSKQQRVFNRSIQGLKGEGKNDRSLVRSFFFFFYNKLRLKVYDFYNNIRQEKERGTCAHAYTV